MAMLCYTGCKECNGCMRCYGKDAEEEEEAADENIG